MVVYLWLLRNCFHYGSFYFTTYESVQLKWKTSFLTTDKKQSLAKQKSMILYHDCFPWTTNDREQEEGLGGSCVAFFFFINRKVLLNSSRQNLLSEWVSKYLISTLKCKIPITLLLKNNLSEIFHGLKSAYGWLVPYPSPLWMPDFLCFKLSKLTAICMGTHRSWVLVT